MAAPAPAVPAAPSYIINLPLKLTSRRKLGPEHWQCNPCWAKKLAGSELKSGTCGFDSLLESMASVCSLLTPSSIPPLSYAGVNLAPILRYVSQRAAAITNLAFAWNEGGYEGRPIGEQSVGEVQTALDRSRDVVVAATLSAMNPTSHTVTAVGTDISQLAEFVMTSSPLCALSDLSLLHAFVTSSRTVEAAMLNCVPAAFRTQTAALPPLLIFALEVDAQIPADVEDPPAIMHIGSGYFVLCSIVHKLDTIGYHYTSHSVHLVRLVESIEQADAASARGVGLASLYDSTGHAKDNSVKVIDEEILPLCQEGDAIPTLCFYLNVQHINFSKGVTLDTRFLLFSSFLFFFCAVF